MRRREFFQDSLVSLLVTPLLHGAENVAPDPWPATSLLAPEELAKRWKEIGAKPVVVYVGFPVLYRAAHLPGAILAGPCSKPAGLESLHKAVAAFARSEEVILYCGCCPFEHCPNVRPAYTAMREDGFLQVRVLHLATNLHTDWRAKGFPIERASEAGT